MSAISRRLCLLLVPALIIGLFAAFGGTSVAFADSCSGDLIDSYGADWDYANNAFITDGSAPDGFGSTRDDAFDDWPVLEFSTDGGSSWDTYTNPDSTACTAELGGQQIAYPADTTTLPGVSITRKIYVPGSGLAFARFLSSFTNTGTDPVTVTIDLAGGFDDFGDLGSDSHTIVNATSSGDGNTGFGDTFAMTAADNWATTWDGSQDSTTGFPDGDPTLAHNWQNGPAGTVSHANDVGTVGGEPDELFWIWRNVTIPPGKTLLYMTTEGMRRDNQETTDLATTLDSEPDALYTGMTADEMSQLQNWCAQDCDKDGVKNNVDNCPSVANPDQSDIDHDGKGDACDSDADGDGLSNSTENEIHTDPLNPDTDGDLFVDGQDACPRTKGGAPDGCPAASTSTVDKTPPNVQITSVDSARNLADLINGVNVTFTCDELCDGSVRALGRIPTGSVFLAATGGFNKTLGRRFIAAFTAGSRTVKVRPCERKPGGSQSSSCLKRLRKAASHRSSFLVKILVTAQDRAGNRKEASKVIRVRR